MSGTGGNPNSILILSRNTGIKSRAWNHDVALSAKERYGGIGTGDENHERHLMGSGDVGRVSPREMRLRSARGQPLVENQKRLWWLTGDTHQNSFRWSMADFNDSFSTPGPRHGVEKAAVFPIWSCDGARGCPRILLASVRAARRTRRSPRVRVRRTTCTNRGRPHRCTARECPSGGRDRRWRARHAQGRGVRRLSLARRVFN